MFALSVTINFIGSDYNKPKKLWKIYWSIRCSLQDIFMYFPKNENHINLPEIPVFIRLFGFSFFHYLAARFLFMTGASQALLCYNVVQSPGNFCSSSTALILF